MIPTLNVLENVTLPLELNGNFSVEVATSLMNRIGLGNRLETYPDKLSGGEQQRVAITRALVHNPSIILADEPTGNLDPALSWEMMKLFEQFNQVGVTVMIASHELDMIKHMHKRIIVLNKGRTVDI